jgi:hypothetical protein
MSVSIVYWMFGYAPIIYIYWGGLFDSVSRGSGKRWTGSLYAEMWLDGTGIGYKMGWRWLEYWLWVGGMYAYIVSRCIFR